MARKSRKQRNAEQLVRTQGNRDAARKNRKPSRDDLARTALWLWVHNTWTVDPDARTTLDSMRNDLVDELVLQRFDLIASLDLFDILAKKYRSDIRPFRIKRHLQVP